MLQSFGKTKHFQGVDRLLNTHHRGDRLRIKPNNLSKGLRCSGGRTMTVNKPTQENFLKRGSPGQCLKGLAPSEPQTDGDTKQILTKKNASP